MAFADRLLLNKTDLVDEAHLKRVESRLRSVNRFAPIQRTMQSNVSVDGVLGIRGFDLKRTLEMDPAFLDVVSHCMHVHAYAHVHVHVCVYAHVPWRWTRRS